MAEQRCEVCAGRGIVLRPPFDSVLAAFQDIAAMRPKATPDFDQGYVTPETTVQRLALMAQQGDLMGRDCPPSAAGIPVAEGGRFVRRFLTSACGVAFFKVQESLLLSQPIFPPQRAQRF
ncbi:bis-aminopropyl spermidine synthase family protein [Geobacillus stearothermophilus]|uniref:bis-aminopropyl spermidine synthase family protein n=1 Tax=Geobacillus stearothermophilus TaxID=1422 RepID=UPI003D215DE8